MRGVVGILTNKFPVQRNIKRSVVSKIVWKKSLIDGAGSTFTNVKNLTQHAVLGAKQSLNRVSDKIRKWYKGRKSGSKFSKSHKVELYHFDL